MWWHTELKNYKCVIVQILVDLYAFQFANRFRTVLNILKVTNIVGASSNATQPHSPSSSLSTIQHLQNLLRVSMYYVTRAQKMFTHQEKQVTDNKRPNHPVLGLKHRSQKDDSQSVSSFTHFFKLEGAN